MFNVDISGIQRNEIQHTCTLFFSNETPEGSVSLLVFHAPDSPSRKWVRSPYKKPIIFLQENIKYIYVLHFDPYL